MPMSKVMEVLLGLLKIQVLYDAGWLLAQRLHELSQNLKVHVKQKGKAEDIQHHEQMNGMQIKFDQDVRSLVSVLDDMGNPFEEDNEDLMVLDTKEIMSSAAVSAVRAVQKIGQDQFESFVKERLVDVSKPLNDVIKRNKFLLFASGKGKSTSNSKQQLAYAKNDSELFSRLYIACQTRDGNLEEFFKHENRPYPLALSQDGQLRFGTKVDLLECFEQLVPSKTMTHKSHL